MNTMLRALCARNICNQDCLELAGIKVPPCSTMRVIASTLSATLWARQTNPFLALDIDSNFLIRSRQFNINYAPRRFNAKYLLV
jgi:hypothetical protein